MLGRRGATIVHGPVMQTGLLHDADATLAATAQALAAPVDVDRAQHRDRHPVVVRGGRERRARRPAASTGRARRCRGRAWARRRAARRIGNGARGALAGARARRAPRWSPSCAHARRRRAARGRAARRRARRRTSPMRSRRSGPRSSTCPSTGGIRPTTPGPPVRLLERGRREASPRHHLHLRVRGRQRLRAVTGSRRPPRRPSTVPWPRWRSVPCAPTRSGTHGVDGRRRAAPGAPRRDGAGAGRGAVGSAPGAARRRRTTLRWQGDLLIGVDHEAQLTASEARLLESLVERSPAVVAKADLVDPGREPHAAEAAVARLRTKLGPLAPAIRSVPGGATPAPSRSRPRGLNLGCDADRPWRVRGGPGQALAGARAGSGIGHRRCSSAVTGAGVTAGRRWAIQA